MNHNLRILARISYGEAYASTKKNDEGTYCFSCRYVKDAKTRPLYPESINQQFKFSVTRTCTNSSMLVAKSVVADGCPPYFLYRKGWNMRAATPKNFNLGDAQGLDSALRAHLRDLNFSLSQECSRIVVGGKWYIPFMFIKEGTEEDRVKNSVFYEMTLEQRRERIFAARNNCSNNKTLVIDVVVPTETIRISGNEAWQTGEHVNGVAWFTGVDGKGESGQVGLGSMIMDRMKWEQERAGWTDAKEKQVRLVKEEHGGIEGWKNFVYYMVVESSVLKRNDRRLMLT